MYQLRGYDNLDLSVNRLRSGINQLAWLATLLAFRRRLGQQKVLVEDAHASDKKYTRIYNV